MLTNAKGNCQQVINNILTTDFSASDACWQMGSVALEILMSGKPLSNKDVIAALINRLELENDIMTLDTYRQLLEYVVYQTMVESRAAEGDVLAGG